MYLYARDHAWVQAAGNLARVGISDFAQKELGEIAYVELPRIGRRVARGEAVCSIDSMKSASEIYAPVSGTIIEANTALADEDGCAAVNLDPRGDGWLFVIEMTDPSELDLLLGESEYTAYISGS
jgi:glycine cleavage system H protein